MNKQQQQKIDKVNKALELMKQGRTIKEVYQEVGYSGADKLKRALKELGYIEIDKQWIQNKANDMNSNTSSNTNSNTSSNTNKMVEVHKQQIADINKLNIVTFMEQEQDTLKAMIEWYKKNSNTINTSNTFIKIELPISENVMISTRSNKVVWEKFKMFAKSNSASFTMGDLVAQALLDFMNKHQ